MSNSIFPNVDSSEMPFLLGLEDGKIGIEQNGKVPRLVVKIGDIAHPLFIDGNSGPKQGRMYVQDSISKKTYWVPSSVEKQAKLLYEKWEHDEPDRFPMCPKLFLNYCKNEELRGRDITVLPKDKTVYGHGNSDNQYRPDSIGTTNGNLSLYSINKKLFEEKGTLPKLHDISGLADSERDFFRYLTLTQKCASQYNANPSEGMYITLYLFSHGLGADIENSVSLLSGKNEKDNAEARFATAMQVKNKLTRNDDANALVYRFTPKLTDLPAGILVSPTETQIQLRIVEDPLRTGKQEFVTKYVRKSGNAGPGTRFNDVPGDEIIYCSSVSNDEAKKE